MSILAFLRRRTGFCTCCDRRRRHLARRRMSCLYADEESNWLTSCLPCFERAEELWREQFREYHAGLL